MAEESQKERQKREDEVVQTAELQTATRMDKMTKTESLDCFNAWVQMCDDADEIHERKSLQEEELKQCVEKAQVILGARGEKKQRVIAEKVWQLWQGAAIRKGSIWNRIGMVFLNLAKETGWAKDREEMTRFWGGRESKDLLAFGSGGQREHPCLRGVL